jgi:hypothetical protein
MFVHLCVAAADGLAAGVAAVLADDADPVLAVDAVVDVEVDEWVVAALATAMLPPNPTPSAPAAMAVPMMTFPSLVRTISSLRSELKVLNTGEAH